MRAQTGGARAQCCGQRWRQPPPRPRPRQQNRSQQRPPKAGQGPAWRPTPRVGAPQGPLESAWPQCIRKSRHQAEWRSRLWPRHKPRGGHCRPTPTRSRVSAWCIRCNGPWRLVSTRRQPARPAASVPRQSPGTAAATPAGGARRRDALQSSPSPGSGAPAAPVRRRPLRARVRPRRPPGCPRWLPRRPRRSPNRSRRRLPRRPRRPGPPCRRRTRSRRQRAARCTPSPGHITPGAVGPATPPAARPGTRWAGRRASRWPARACAGGP
mmetsp:Transcript_106834/g.297416  ORF Transcript_106834/g.297416 Transcript_106834/m.297416 type:complete len:268 (+) Transcript_106834:1231-2034(+)